MGGFYGINSLFEPASSGQSMNCNFSHVRVGFTRERGRLPLGLLPTSGENLTSTVLSEIYLLSKMLIIPAVPAGNQMHLVKDLVTVTVCPYIRLSELPENTDR